MVGLRFSMFSLIVMMGILGGEANPKKMFIVRIDGQKSDSDDSTEAPVSEPEQGNDPFYHFGTNGNLEGPFNNIEEGTSDNNGQPGQPSIPPTNVELEFGGQNDGLFGGQIVCPPSAIGGRQVGGQIGGPQFGGRITCLPSIGGRQVGGQIGDPQFGLQIGGPQYGGQIGEPPFRGLEFDGQTGGPFVSFLCPPSAIGGHQVGGQIGGPQFGGRFTCLPSIGGRQVGGQIGGPPFGLQIGGPPYGNYNPFDINNQYGQVGFHNACLPQVWSFANCPRKPAPFLIDMTDELKYIIVNLHNQRRDILISQNMPGFGYGQNLPTMSWSSDLANLAETNVMQCKMEHDTCSSSLYVSSGQNLAIHSYGGPFGYRTDKDLVKASIDLWWEEYKTKQREIPMRLNNWIRNPIGYFTELARDKYMAIGCAVARFYKDNSHKFLMACNYATASQFGQPIRIRSVSEEYENAARRRF